MCLTLRKVRTLEVKPGILDKVHAVCSNVEQSLGYPGRHGSCVEFKC